MYKFLRRFWNFAKRNNDRRQITKNHIRFNPVSETATQKKLSRLHRRSLQSNTQQLIRYYSNQSIREKLKPLPKGIWFGFALVSLFLVGIYAFWLKKQRDNSLPFNEIKRLFDENRYDEVIKLADHFLANNPNAFEIYYKRGAAWYAKGDYDKAIKDYNKTIELNPNSEKIYAERGLVWAKKGNYDKAIKDFDKAIEINPSFEHAYFARGLVWIKKEGYDKAIEDFNKAIELNSNSKIPKSEIIYVERGVAWTRKEDYEKAIKDFDKAIELNPNFEEAYVNRGLVWAEKENYDKAIKDCDKAIALNPNSEEAYINRGFIWTRRGNYDKAIEDCNKAIEINPSFEHAYFIRSMTLAKKGDYGKAIEDCNKVIEVNPNFEMIYVVRSLCWMEKNKFEESIADLNKVTEISKSNALLFLVVTYCKHFEKYSSANTVCELILKKDPNNEQAYFLQGEILLHLNDPLKAINSFRKALEIDPYFIEAQHALEIAKKRTGLLPNELAYKEKQILLNALSIGNYPTHYIYARLCRETYENNPKAPDGWDILCTSKSPDYKKDYDKEDYFGIVFRHKSTGQIVAAHKGTEVKWGDILADTHLFLQRIPKQYEIAKSFIAQVEKDYLLDIKGKPQYSSNTILHTGHSLGAGLAELLASIHNQSAVTFDSPGVKEILENKFGKESYNTNNIIGYLTRPNIVNTCNHHIGYRLKLNLLGLEDQPSIATDAMGVGGYLAGLFGFKQTKQYLYNTRNITEIVLKQLQSHSLDNIIQIFESETGSCITTPSTIVKWPHGVQACISLEDTAALELKQKINFVDPNVISNAILKHKVENTIGYQFTPWNGKSLPLTIFDSRTMDLLKAFAENSANEEQKTILASFDPKVLQMFRVEKNSTRGYQFVVSDKSVLSAWEIKGYIEYHANNVRRRENIILYSPSEPNVHPWQFLFSKISFTNLFSFWENKSNLISSNEHITNINNKSVVSSKPFFEGVKDKEEKNNTITLQSSFLPKITAE